MAYLLREYSNQEIDMAKTMMMILIHDIVEIDAGDTYAYDEELLKTQGERESKAADRLYGLLPEDQGEELRSLFEEFEDCQTPEAKFARTMDNFQPLLLNHANGGSDWSEHKVKRSQIEKRNEKTMKGSVFIRKYLQDIIEEHVASGEITDD